MDAVSRFKFVALLCLLVGLAALAKATTYTLVCAGPSCDWTSATSWSPLGLPGNETTCDDVVLASSANGQPLVLTFFNNASLCLQAITLGAQVSLDLSNAPLVFLTVEQNLTLSSSSNLNLPLESSGLTAHGLIYASSSTAAAVWLNGTATLAVGTLVLGDNVVLNLHGANAELGATVVLGDRAALQLDGFSTVQLQSISVAQCVVQPPTCAVAVGEWSVLELFDGASVFIPVTLSGAGASISMAVQGGATTQLDSVDVYSAGPGDASAAFLFDGSATLHLTSGLYLHESHVTLEQSSSDVTLSSLVLDSASLLDVGTEVDWLFTGDGLQLAGTIAAHADVSFSCGPAPACAALLSEGATLKLDMDAEFDGTLVTTLRCATLAGDGQVMFDGALVVSSSTQPGCESVVSVDTAIVSLLTVQTGAVVQLTGSSLFGFLSNGTVAVQSGAQVSIMPASSGSNGLESRLSWQVQGTGSVTVMKGASLYISSAGNNVQVSGHFVVQNNAALSIGPQVSVSAPLSIDGSATLAGGAFAVYAAASVAGQLTVLSELGIYVASGATLNAGSWVCDSSSQLTILLSGAGPALIAVAGNAALAGSLTLQFSPGAAPTTPMTIMTFGSSSGSLASTSVAGAAGSVVVTSTSIVYHPGMAPARRAKHGLGTADLVGIILGGLVVVGACVVLAVVLSNRSRRPGYRTING